MSVCSWWCKSDHTSRSVTMVADGSCCLLAIIKDKTRLYKHGKTLFICAAAIAFVSNLLVTKYNPWCSINVLINIFTFFSFHYFVVTIIILCDILNPKDYLLQYACTLNLSQSHFYVNIDEKSTYPSLTYISLNINDWHVQQPIWDRCFTTNQTPVFYNQSETCVLQPIRDLCFDHTV